MTTQQVPAGQPQEETKARILDAAARVFGEHGYHGATMTRIATEADVAKGTVYWYFSGKEELFQGLIESAYLRLYAKLKLVLTNNKLSPGEKLRRFIDEYLAFFAEHHPLSKVVSNEIPGFSKDFHRKMMEWSLKFIAINEELFEHGVIEGVFREDMSSRQMGVVVAGIVSAIGSDHFLSARNLDRESEGEFIFNLLLDGVARKG